MQQVQDNDFGVNKFPYFKQILSLMRYSSPYEIYLGLTDICIVYFRHQILSVVTETRKFQILK